MAAAALRVCIVGSGNWGSAIARIVGTNAARLDEFHSTVQMWVFEEEVNGRKLTELINETHENVKYLPGHLLPENVNANPDLSDSVKDADLLIFVLPHQFLKRICPQIVGRTSSRAFACSLIKGVNITDGKLELLSDHIKDLINMPCSVLMGANLANEVADGHFCESTIGSTNNNHIAVLKLLFQTPKFRVTAVRDVAAVELCGALKNIVAVGAGICDGLGYGNNTKAAVIRMGFMEIISFCELFYPGAQLETFLQSCGVADLVTTCYGGRNRRVSEAFAKSGRPLVELEQEMLNGQKLQGPDTAAELYVLLEAKDLRSRFPIFVCVHEICTGQKKASDFIACLENHPLHL